MDRIDGAAHDCGRIVACLLFLVADETGERGEARSMMPKACNYWSLDQQWNVIQNRLYTRNLSQSYMTYDCEAPYRFLGMAAVAQQMVKIGVMSDAVVTRRTSHDLREVFNRSLLGIHKMEHP